MMTDGKYEGTPPEEGDDALWRLLERAPQSRPVSPYFARRVLREVALREEARPGVGALSNRLARTWQTWFRQPRWAFAGAFAAVALLAAGGIGLSSLRQHLPVAPVVASNPEPAVPETPAVEEMPPPDAGTEVASNPPGTAALPSDPVVTAQDVEVIADLDNVLSREESRLWTEDDTARF